MSRSNSSKYKGDRERSVFKTNKKGKKAHSKSDIKGLSKRNKVINKNFGSFVILNQKIIAKILRNSIGKNYSDVIQFIKNKFSKFERLVEGCMRGIVAQENSGWVTQKFAEFRVDENGLLQFNKIKDRIIKYEPIYIKCGTQSFFKDSDLLWYEVSINNYDEDFLIKKHKNEKLIKKIDNLNTIIVFGSYSKESYHNANYFCDRATIISLASETQLNFIKNVLEYSNGLTK